MLNKKLISAVAVAGILATSVTAAQAQVNRVRDRNVAIGVGLIGAAMLGSAIASNNNRQAQTYYAPQQPYYPSQGYYAQPQTYVQPAASVYYESAPTYYAAPATEVVYVRERPRHRHYREYREYGDRYYYGR